MTLTVRNDPFRDVLSLRDAMDRLFQESFVAPRTLPNGGRGWVAMDVQETEDGFVLTAALPGWRAEEVDVTVHEATVTISGRLAEKAQDEKRTFHLRERARGQFSRAFTLPVPVDADRAEARFELGELVLTLPKAESARPRKIKVAGAAG